MSLLELHDHLSYPDSTRNCDKVVRNSLSRRKQFAICNSCYWCASTNLDSFRATVCPQCGCDSIFESNAISESDLLKRI